MNNISLWDMNLCFFFSKQIIFDLTYFQMNHLRNLFLKCFKEFKLWFEIQKMFETNLINFSFRKIYWANDISSFSLLSRFLFEFYIAELDTYILDLSLDINSTFDLFVSKDFNHRQYLELLLTLFPLKLEKNLVVYKTVSKLNFQRISNFFIYFKSHSFGLCSNKFARKICWARYVSFILFGFFSSKNYAKFISEKVLHFVRSSLMFDLKEADTNLSAQNGFYFLGFNVKSKVQHKTSLNNSVSSLLTQSYEKYKSRVKFRINVYRKKILNSIVNRTNSELFLLFLSATKNRNLSLLSLKNKKIWSFIFQQECLRALQYGKLLFTRDTVDNINYRLFSEVRSSSLNKFAFYRKYSFNLYIRKLQLIFKELIGSTNSLFHRSVLPIDLVLHKYLKLLNKKISFIYENLYFNTSNALSYNSIYLKSPKKFPLDKSWKILVSKKLLLSKLRSWGFIHPYKNRPISNSKFLFMEDIFIVKNFSFFINKFFIWFRCCDNFLSLKFILNVLKQSCFLTICRKHNKSKAWAYSVFTPNLFLFRNFSSFDHIFSKRHFSYKINKKYLIEKNIFHYDEKFFLINFAIN